MLVVMSDLLFRSRVDEVARRVGLPLRVAKSLEQLDRHLEHQAVALAIVDLEAERLDAAEAIRRIKASAGGGETPVLAFAGHTNLAAIEAGRAAGATVVLARSAFTAQLPTVLSRVAEAARAQPEG